jgi:hypothetical protein
LIITQFFYFISTLFGRKVKSVQCDNGCEFDNSSSMQFFLAHGLHLQMSCPYTSPQNVKAKHMLRTTNNIVRTLLFQASMPAQYWVTSLDTATYLLNYLPTKTITASCPYTTLYNTMPTYEHLRVFGCGCYPDLSVTAPHKIAPCSTRCVFIGYSPDHKGYRYLDLSTNCTVISQHVVFDEAYFPFAASPHPTNDYEFLSEMDSVLSPIGTRLSAGTSVTTAGSLTVPLGGRTSPSAEASGLTVPSMVRSATPSTTPRLHQVV